MTESDVARGTRVLSAFAGFRLDPQPRFPVHTDRGPGPQLGRDGRAVALGGRPPTPILDPAPQRRPVRRVTFLVPQFTRLLGAIYLLTGIAGFVLGGLTGNAVTTLVIFDLNPVHSGVHTVVGAAMIASTLIGADVPRIVLTLAGGTYLAIGVVGLLLIAGGELGGGINVLALNQADNVLHILTGALAVFVGLTGESADDAIVWGG